ACLEGLALRDEALQGVQASEAEPSAEGGLEVSASPNEEEVVEPISQADWGRNEMEDGDLS
ncbi:MAG: hypothetical protein ACUVXD_02930, partial [Thermodesulfobacteriota bacterium]